MPLTITDPKPEIASPTSVSSVRRAARAPPPVRNSSTGRSGHGDRPAGGAVGLLELLQLGCRRAQQRAPERAGRVAGLRSRVRGPQRGLDHRPLQQFLELAELHAMVDRHPGQRPPRAGGRRRRGQPVGIR